MNPYLTSIYHEENPNIEKLKELLLPLLAQNLTQEESL